MAGLRVSVTVEGMDSFRAKVRGSFRSLEADLREAVLLAAADGIREAQEHHPYEDHREEGKSYEVEGAIGLTDTAHAEQPRVGGRGRGFDAEMVWPAPYGSFVDQGTSRSAAYPFTPQAIEKATSSLGEHVAHAVRNFERSFGR